MITNKSELSEEKRITEIGKIRQLELITQHTGRWMSVLFHECNGLLSNVNWISRIMQQDSSKSDLLPNGTFEELNQTSQKAAMYLKSIHSYLQLLTTIAGRFQKSEDVMQLDAAVLIRLNPQFKRLNFSFTSTYIEVSKTFLKVLNFLLTKIVEVSMLSGVDPERLNFLFEFRSHRRLKLSVFSSSSFWQHDFGRKLPNGSFNQIPHEPSARHYQMFYELMGIVGADVKSGCNEQRSFSTESLRPRTASELIQREISANHLEISIPLGLGVQ